VDVANRALRLMNKTWVRESATLTIAAPGNALIVGLDARTKGPSPLVGESNMSPESELSPKLRVLLLKFWTQIFCHNI
jgi:hypothetical protein